MHARHRRCNGNSETGARLSRGVLEGNESFYGLLASMRRDPRPAIFDDDLGIRIVRTGAYREFER